MHRTSLFYAILLDSSHIRSPISLHNSNNPTHRPSFSGIWLYRHLVSLFYRKKRQLTIVSVMGSKRHYHYLRHHFHHTKCQKMGSLGCSQTIIQPQQYHLELFPNNNEPVIQCDRCVNGVEVSYQPCSCLRSLQS